MKMEYVAMVRRGWPNGSALDMAETIEAGQTLQNGDWVYKAADGGVQKVPGGLTSAVALAGLVMQGNGDSGSATYANKAVVLWSGFVADISNYDASASYVPGSPLMTGNTTGGTTGTLTLQTGSYPIIGYVLNVTPVSAQNTASLTIVVK